MSGFVFFSVDATGVLLAPWVEAGDTANLLQSAEQPPGNKGRLLLPKTSVLLRLRNLSMTSNLKLSHLYYTQGFSLSENILQRDAYENNLKQF